MREVGFLLGAGGDIESTLGGVNLRGVGIFLCVAGMNDSRNIWGSYN